MKTESVEKIRQMQAMTRALSDDQLITSYLLVVEAADTAETRLVRGVLQDELERRIPAIAEATEAWVNDLDSDDTQEDVVLRCLANN
ncbi:hypothetical protein C8D88_116104 [Lentzea atacamensis]|uniref:Uncharacterized protein n=1 Tax=Lentzea atacamensis TaxID=531938 RepID=A0A316HMB1_9PSEU|nr:hypothetical protein [Lentzea atacamensis]PWK81693.1 hypothetical protein C8D88_116104 [Lentzea atacamensis]